MYNIISLGGDRQVIIIDYHISTSLAAKTPSPITIIYVYFIVYQKSIIGGYGIVWSSRSVVIIY